METTGVRFVRLLKILIKIGIMFLVITGVILINKKYMSKADGCERERQIKLLEGVDLSGPTVSENYF